MSQPQLAPGAEEVQTPAISDVPLLPTLVRALGSGARSGTKALPLRLRRLRRLAGVHHDLLEQVREIAGIPIHNIEVVMT